MLAWVIQTRLDDGNETIGERRSSASFGGKGGAVEGRETGIILKLSRLVGSSIFLPLLVLRSINSIFPSREQPSIHQKIPDWRGKNHRVLPMIQIDLLWLARHPT